MSVNRMVMVDIPGFSLDDETRAHLTHYKPGGIILFRKNIVDRVQTRALIEDLKSILGDDLLLAIDAEGGGVWRTTDLPNAPSAMSLGAATDLNLARDIGAMVARGLRSMGINWNFAPVLDLNNNPFNPVISDRSFGEDPKRATALALAWAEGLMREGVAACGKHFPGHGDTKLDSHLALPTVSRNLEGLEEYELVPFRMAAPHLPSIMTAHIVYPSIDPDLPATLSKKILTGLLRERGQFEGVIVTDSMGMHAIDKNWGRGEAAVMSVNAGSDMVEALGSRESQAQTLDALENAEKNGVILSERITASLERLHNLASRFPIAPLDYAPDLEVADRALASRAWGAGITEFGSVVLPKPGSSITLIAPDAAPEENVSEVGVAGANLVTLLSSEYSVKAILHPARDPLSVLEQVKTARAAGDFIVYASTSRHRMIEAGRELARAAQPDLHLALWNAYTVADVPAPALLTYGYRPEALAALMRVLRGETRATGVAPVKLR
jgi:beta-N-acetylhexosaminidase